MPFVTAWAGEHRFESVPTAVYGVVLFMAAIAYYILVRALIAQEGKDSALTRAIGQDFKGKMSVVLYGVAMPVALLAPWISVGIYALVAAIWFIPDKRIEKQLRESK